MASNVEMFMASFTNNRPAVLGLKYTDGQTDRATITFVNFIFIVERAHYMYQLIIYVYIFH